MIRANDTCEHSLWFINDYDGKCTYIVETNVYVDGGLPIQCNAQRRMPSKACIEFMVERRVAEITKGEKITVRAKRLLITSTRQAIREVLENAIAAPIRAISNQ